ncbi:MAG: ParB/RepB/Spo0J family partition protein [Clostridia bacterium]|nr:ParB/RepB/Spo0J family partition protein [Clostridia bacterium]
MAKGLGKGLDALFEETGEAYDNMMHTGRGHEFTEEELKSTEEIPLSQIEINPNQPRKQFDEQGIKELGESIQRHGVIMPIVVNDDGKGGKYMIIAGERRYRACLAIGKKTIPAVIRKYSPREIEEISLIENLQREDLNPIDAATAMKQLMTDYKLTQDELAERIGKSRPAITNTIRLLKLSPDVMALVKEGKLTAGHARVLVPLAAADQLSFAQETIKHQYSVRDLEKRVKAFTVDPEALRAGRARKKQITSAELNTLVERMRYTFRTKVTLIGSDKKGRIYLDYYSKDDLDRISEILDIIERQ